jgi:hypothetical protein
MNWIIHKMPSGDDKEAALETIENAFHLGNSFDMATMIIREQMGAGKSSEATGKERASDATSESNTRLHQEHDGHHTKQSPVPLVSRDVFKGFTDEIAAAGDDQAAREQVFRRVDLEVERQIFKRAEAGEELFEGQLHTETSNPT